MDRSSRRAALKRLSVLALLGALLGQQLCQQALALARARNA
jgi:hypothetical protein